jgi:hypothetical protein
LSKLLLNNELFELLEELLLEVQVSVLLFAGSLRDGLLEFLVSSDSLLVLFDLALEQSVVSIFGIAFNDGPNSLLLLNLIVQLLIEVRHLGVDLVILLRVATPGHEDGGPGQELGERRAGPVLFGRTVNETLGNDLDSLKVLRHYTVSHLNIGGILQSLNQSWSVLKKSLNVRRGNFLLV